jgi:hypothetical protein
MSTIAAVVDGPVARSNGLVTGADTAELVHPGRRDRSPGSLVMLLARAAERVRTDPEANFSRRAVRWTAEMLRARLDARRPLAGGGVDDAD